MTDIIQLRDLSHRYPGGGDVLAGINFSLKRGEMAFLTGPSGAGKSTFLKLIGLLARPTRGQVIVNGNNLAELKGRQIALYRRQVGMIFQDSQLLNSRTVFDNVALPLLIRAHSGEDIGRRVRAALDTVGLRGFERAYPPTLSGGEQQRVGIARAVVARPALLLADEPTGNLDVDIAHEVLQLFMRFNQVGTSVLVATHAVNLIETLPCRKFHLEQGQLEPLSGDASAAVAQSAPDSEPEAGLGSP